MLLSSLQSKLYSYLGYTTISTDSECDVNTCSYKTSNPDATVACQQSCSSYAWCVGYSTSCRSSSDCYCNLHSSSTSCPSGLRYIRYGYTAYTASNLITSSWKGSGRLCRAKLGKVPKIKETAV